MHLLDILRIFYFFYINKYIYYPLKNKYSSTKIVSNPKEATANRH